MKRIAACAVAAVLAACADSTIPTAEPTLATAAPASAAGAAGTAMPTPAPQTASDLLECDGDIATTGGRADGFGPFGGGATADEALESFLAAPAFLIPLRGYTMLGVVGDRTVYTYDRLGETKVVIVVSPRFAEHTGFPLTVEELRTCDAAELGPVDFGPGIRTWFNETTGLILTDFAGPEHCGWQSARMLHVEEEDGATVKQYVRDPRGVFDEFPGRNLETYAEGVDLPADAEDSGYRSPSGHELWFTASDRAAYVVTPDGVERWPRADPPHGCA